MGSRMKKAWKALTEREVETVQYLQCDECEEFEFAPSLMLTKSEHAESAMYIMINTVYCIYCGKFYQMQKQENGKYVWMEDKI